MKERWHLKTQRKIHTMSFRKKLLQGGRFWATQGPMDIIKGSLKNEEVSEAFAKREFGENDSFYLENFSTVSEVL